MGFVSEEIDLPEHGLGLSHIAPLREGGGGGAVGGSTPNRSGNSRSTPPAALGDSPLSEGACLGRDTSQEIDHEVALVGVLRVNICLGKGNPMVYAHFA